MSDPNKESLENDMEAQTLQKVGFYSAVLLVLFTMITLGIAICTPPISGPFCIIQAQPTHMPT